MIKKLLHRGYRLIHVLRILQIARQTYYNWVHYTPTQRSIDDQKIGHLMTDIWQNNYKVYGRPRLQVALRSLGIHIGNTRLIRLMHIYNVHSLMHRRFKKPGTYVEYDQRPNLIKNNENHHNVWRADITYLEQRPGKWVYLSSIYDEKMHQILAHKVSEMMTSQLVCETLTMALHKHKKPSIVHSDMGSQYTSMIFENQLQNEKIKHSYSLKGHPYDNGPIEAFHSVLKREFIYLTKFKSYDDLVLRTENYVHWYNHERIRIAV